MYYSTFKSVFTILFFFNRYIHVQTVERIFCGHIHSEVTDQVGDDLRKA